MNEGNDTFDGSLFFPQAVTVVGGNDSNDGSDSIITGTGADFVFGNGGNDTIRANEGGDTVIGGVGNDSPQCTGNATDLMFGNEGDDTVQAASVVTRCSAARATTRSSAVPPAASCSSAARVTTRSTGSSASIRSPAAAEPICSTTRPSRRGWRQCQWRRAGRADHRCQLRRGPVPGPADRRLRRQCRRRRRSELEASAETAIQASLALGGGGAQHVRRSSRSTGARTSRSTRGVNTLFTDTLDFLFDITGVTGTIGASDFIA